MLEDGQETYKDRGRATGQRALRIQGPARVVIRN